MAFTALHRALGLPPGPITDQLVQDAVDAHVEETDGLDWKRDLPAAKGITKGDFPKDVAAMANSGGGIIVYGVRESEKAATERVDVGELTENQERSLLNAAYAAIFPSVFGVTVHKVGEEGNRAVAVEVPASVDGPHLIYHGDFFGAPIRNGADTAWMRQWQLEAAYRARFEERRHTAEALFALHAEAATGRDITIRAWLTAAAHPRVPRISTRLHVDNVRAVMQHATELASVFARAGIHPLLSTDYRNPRHGLRRWVAVNTATSERSRWKEAWATIHNDGSATLAAAVGGRPCGNEGPRGGWQVEADAIEPAVADFMALVRATAEATGNDEYYVRVSINWSGPQPLELLGSDSFGYPADNALFPLHKYTPVETSLNATTPDLDYLWLVHDLALDCVNQGGVPALRFIHPPARPTADTPH